jgi:curli biogenesis system outer membrane secretion channel CsgG
MIGQNDDRKCKKNRVPTTNPKARWIVFTCLSGAIPGVDSAPWDGRGAFVCARLFTFSLAMDFIMKRFLILGCALAFLASGCSTVTKPVTNKAPEAANISPALVQPEQKVLKRKVAIARFSNETKHGNSFLLDQQNDRIGKQAMDILSARLTESGKFLMLERADLNRINDEKALTNVTSEMIGADYLIVGSVSEFGRNASSEVGIFSRNKKQTAQATVNVRLLDVRTGQIVFSEEGTGIAEVEANTVFGVGERAGYDASLDDKALSAAISKLVSNLMENLLENPWRSYVLGEQDGYYLIAGGKEQGIEAGNTFAVMTRGRQVKNPQTGIMIELPGQEVARLTVVNSVGTGLNEVSLCEVSSGNLSGQKLADLYIQEAGAKP